MTTVSHTHHHHRPKRLLAIAAALILFTATSCGGDGGEEGATVAAEENQTSEVVSTTPQDAIETTSADQDETPTVRGPDDYPDQELASIAMNIMGAAEVTNPEWERHIRDRFTGPGVDAWIEGRHRAIAEIGQTAAVRLAAEAVRAEVLERGTGDGANLDRAKVQVYMRHQNLQGLARFDLRLLFEEDIWKVRVPETGLAPQEIER